MKQKDLEVKNHPEINSKAMCVWWGLSAKGRYCKSGSIWSYCAELVKYSGN